MATPLLDGVSVLPYAALDAIHADPVEPMPALERSALLPALPTEAVDALLARVGPGSGSPQLVVELRHLGGAVSRPGTHPSAFSSRDAAYAMFVAGVPVNPWVEAHGRFLLEAMSPWTSGRLLPNFAATDDPAVYARCYTPQVLERLRRAVRVYDPSGVLVAGDLPGR